MKIVSIAFIGVTAFLPGHATAQNAVTDWNDIAVSTALAGNSAIPKNSPNGMVLYLAYVHLATHDAVNAIEHRFQPYGPAFTAPSSASSQAAVAAAAYYVLSRITSLIRLPP